MLIKWLPEAIFFNIDYQIFITSLRGRAWQKSFESLIVELKQQLRHTKIVHDENRRVHEIFSNTPFDLMRERLWISMTALAFFSALAFMKTDWVTSKPILGFVGVMSGSLATTATFGLLLVCGVEFNALVASTPFLTLGWYFEKYKTNILILNC